MTFTCFLCLQLEEDHSFQEFLSLHQNRTQVPTWANDAMEKPSVTAKAKETGKKETKKPKSSATDDYLNFDSDESDEMEEAEEEEEEEEDEPQSAGQPVCQNDIYWVSIQRYLLFIFT